MNMQKPLKCAAAVLSGILVMTGSVGMTTAETTLSDSAKDGQIQVTTENVSVSADTKSEASGQWKAEITDYDSSLSLISYEKTPEVTQAEKAKAEEEKKKAEEEEKKKALENAEPSPVDANLTGGYVGEIPAAQGVAEPTPQSGEFAFTTYGWGHGVGLSQNGANAYAMYSGWTYQDILFHYYPGTYLMNTGTGGAETVTAGGLAGDALTIVSGIVYREIGSSMSYEAIKAQAVAVYTYIKYHGDDAHDLRCKSNPPENVVSACREVLGEALYYDGEFAMTCFSASSGGASANCYDVFTADIPYLRSVPSDYDASCDPHYGTITYYASSEVKRLVEARYGITLSDNPANWFQLTEGAGGYISYVDIDNQITVKGYDFKLCLDLKSSNFDLYYAQ